MGDELDSLKKKELGELLLTEIGYDQETVDWHYKRHTAEGLRTVIRNFRAHDIIARLASKAGEGGNVTILSINGVELNALIEM